MPKKIKNIHDQILTILIQQSSVTATELVEVLGCSLPTVRRTCRDIAKTYNLIYKRGRLVFHSNISREKLIIAQRSVSFIKDGDIIFLGAGQTILSFCWFLHKFKQLIVITNSIPILTELQKLPNITTICVGGILQHQDKALVGEFSESFVKNFHINKLFLGTEGFDVRTGASRSVIQKNMAEHLISNLNGQIFIVTESFKFHNNCAWIWLPLEKIDTIITDNDISPESINQIKKTSIHLEIINIH
ncbi:MAG: DeoR/GlpR family DNA-binding transcription regulator [Brevinema sp.]